jgi:SUMO ligase MMS21 Smc5/6 complex component
MTATRQAHQLLRKVEETPARSMNTTKCKMLAMQRQINPIIGETSAAHKMACLRNQ